MSHAQLIPLELVPPLVPDQDFILLYLEVLELLLHHVSHALVVHPLVHQLV